MAPTESMQPTTSGGAAKTVVMAAVWFTLVMAIGWAAMASYSFQRHAWTGVAAAGAAAAICWVAGLVALVVVGWQREPDQVVNAIGLAMLFRMGIPLLVGIFLTRQGGPLVEAGLFGMIVGFYLVGLIVETLLAVRLTAGARKEQVRESV